MIPPPPQALDPQADWLKLGLGITELAGEAGVGKSQIAMSLCVQAVVCASITGDHDSTTRAIYISLAGGQATMARIAHRMQQMADASESRPNGNNPYNAQQKNSSYQPPNPYLATTRASSVDSQQSSSQSVLSQILTHSIRNQEDLFSLLQNDLPECLQQQKQTNSSPVGFLNNVAS